MNLKLNDYINVFYRDKPDKIRLLKTTKDYKEFIDIIYNKDYDLDKLLMVYRDDIIRLGEDISRDNSSLEEWVQDEINDIDDCYDYNKNIGNTYEVYDENKELIGIVEDGVFKEIEKKIDFISPKNIKKELDKYIIGQTEATKIMANVVSRQLMKINKKDEIKERGLNLPSPNVIMCGSSGSGKTYLLEKISELYDIPMVTVDASTLSKTGYIGESFSNFAKDLYDKCNGNIKKMETAIVYIDEIDKIANKGGVYDKIDVTSSVQSEILRSLQSNDIPIRNEITGTTIATINTKDMLFVLSGAFEEIEEIVKKRLIKEGKIKTKSMGFGGNVVPKKLSIEELRKQITKKDLQEYGMKNEILGRCEIMCNLNPLSEEMVRDILLADNGILREYKDMFKLYGKTLKLDKNIIDYIVKETIKNKQLGVRALRSIIENLLNETLYNMPSEKKKVYTINKNMLGVG